MDTERSAENPWGLEPLLDASELDYESTSKNDRTRIRTVTHELLDPVHVSWVNVDPVDRERGTSQT